MKTDLGMVVLKLYNDTPVHKQNFIKLVNEGYYDGVAFHRVINQFMVQAGDASTKENADPQQSESGYTLEAEISSTYVHTAGKLAAARELDEVNPEKRSSGTQFFIVTGKPIYPEVLNERIEEYNLHSAYTKEMRADYARLGGAPHLDFEYTIFGEVVLGMDIIRKIEQIPTDGERPLKAIRIQSMKIR